MVQLGPEFFRQSPVACARGLIGCVFDWEGCAGRIVETEAYAERGDEACHTFFRPSARHFVAKQDAGAAYVYLNYGVHWMFNVLVKGPQGAGFVLFRALEPTAGVELMARRRGQRDPRRLCSGPGKLTQALGIGRDAHGAAFLRDSGRGISLAAEPIDVVADSRIGISRGTHLRWRFTEKGSLFVSQRPKAP